MINRNKFFSVVGLGIAGVLFSKILPFGKRSLTKRNRKNIKVKINPVKTLAIPAENVNNPEYVTRILLNIMISLTIMI